MWDRIASKALAFPKEGQESRYSLPASINIQLLKASDFNEKLRERGVPKEATVQRIGHIARDEREVRELIEAIWESSTKAEEILNGVAEKNKEVHEFEKMLES